MFSISGSLTHSKSSSTTNATGSETGSSSTRRLDAAQQEELKRLLTQFGLSANKEDAAFSKSAAIKDATALVNSIFSDYKEQELPQIIGGMSTSGAYSATGGQLLTNDAYARTTNKAAQTVLANIASYADIANQKRQTSIAGLDTAVNALIASQEDTTMASEFKTRSKTNSKGWSHKIAGSYGMGG